MSEDRLAAALEVTAFLRRAEAAGGFGAVLYKGDEQRGTVLLVITQRGTYIALLERTLGPAGAYQWSKVGPEPGDSQRLAQYLAQRRRADPDCWMVELDIPLSERFIAETIAST